MRSQMFLSHEHKTSCDMGYLVPIASMEVLPGDTFIQSTNVLARVAPLATPVMHTVELRVHHWYVPMRHLFPEWEEWITGADIVTEKPKLTVDADPANNVLIDYIGIPPWAAGAEYDATWVRAYNFIWNHRYRDEELHAAIDLDDTTLKRICWEKDYFTTCRPQPQQGVPAAAQVEFASDVPVMGLGTTGAQTYTPDVSLLQTGGTTSTVPAKATTESNIFMEGTATAGGEPNVRVAAGTVGGTVNIDELRRAIALQRFQEARMRFGDRYEDYLRWLGVNPSTGRLDRPEYLGGGSQNIQFSEVLSTADTTDATVGDMYGHGIASARSRRYRKMFEEHGYVFSLLSARPKTVYQDGLCRKFTRFDMLDYWQKEFEILPWQEVKQQEIHAAADPAAIFGYQQRYDEYRHEGSRVSGSYRRGETEADWHMGREFETPPALNDSFVECTPTDRIYSDKAMPELLINAKHNIRAKRLVRSNAMFGVNTAI